MENADKALPEIFVSLGTERFNLVPSFATFCRFEEVSGKNGLDLTTWIQPSATDLVMFLWAAIGGKKSGKTVEEVADLMQAHHLLEVKKIVQEMFKKSELPENLKNDDAAK